MKTVEIYVILVITAVMCAVALLTFSYSNRLSKVESYKLKVQAALINDFGYSPFTAKVVCHKYSAVRERNRRAKIPHGVTAAEMVKLWSAENVKQGGVRI